MTVSFAAKRPSKPVINWFVYCLLPMTENESKKANYQCSLDNDWTACVCGAHQPSLVLGTIHLAYLAYCMCAQNTTLWMRAEPHLGGGSGSLRPMTLKFKLGQDFCTMHLPTKFRHPTFNQVIMLKNKQRDAAENIHLIPLCYPSGDKLSLALRSASIKPNGKQTAIVWLL